MPKLAQTAAFLHAMPAWQGRAALKACRIRYASAVDRVLVAVSQQALRGVDLDLEDLLLAASIPIRIFRLAVAHQDPGPGPRAPAPAGPSQPEDPEVSEYNS